MKKEKHKWKKVKEKKYLNFIGDSEHHHIVYDEYYECEKCGVKKYK